MGGPWMQPMNGHPYNASIPPPSFGYNGFGYPPAGGAPPYQPAHYPGYNVGMPYGGPQRPMMPMQMPYPTMPTQATSPSAPPDREMNQILSVGPKEQKQLIGERIFQHIEKKGGKHMKQAGKITGMLLEMESTALINLLHQPELLDAKIEQAGDVLRNAMRAARLEQTLRYQDTDDNNKEKAVE